MVDGQQRRRFHSASRELCLADPVRFAEDFGRSVTLDPKLVTDAGALMAAILNARCW